MELIANISLNWLQCHVSAAEAHYLLALLFNSFNQLYERDKAAAAYRRCILKLSSAQNI